MIICGIKITHDSAIALIDNGKLIFCYEFEKLDNNLRYISIADCFDWVLLENILNDYGYSFPDIDQIVIDGWGEFDAGSSGDDYPVSKILINDRTGNKFKIELAGYGMLVGEENLLNRSSYSYPDQQFYYSSYLHVSGHVMSAYCSSPFALKRQDSYILVWDGGMCPQLFYFNYQHKRVENLGCIFFLLGNVYAALASSYKPFNHLSMDDLSIAGKVMAYIAKGTCRNDVLKALESVFDHLERQTSTQATFGSDLIEEITSNFLQEIVSYGENNDIEPVDMMATFHALIEEMLVKHLGKMIAHYPSLEKNFCYVGGCALNIKWNSAIRSSGIFQEMWIPPFPNDAGSAIGAACCEMFLMTGEPALDWDVYSGPGIKMGEPNDNTWNTYDNCSCKDLAEILHFFNEPIVVLNGRAELGPRALGNRSILAAATVPFMKKKLNKIKKREDYRPVAPICLEEDAPSIFDPGNPDPFMLYDHMVRKEWAARIPAICHLDGSARLQTINAKNNLFIHEVLTEYKKLSGIPLLCNTSANFNGKGFFPDAHSAMLWGGTDAVYCNDKLFVRSGSEICNYFRNALSGCIKKS